MPDQTNDPRAPGQAFMSSNSWWSVPIQLTISLYLIFREVVPPRPRACAPPPGLRAP